jgi:hypothetical protein
MGDEFGYIGRVRGCGCIVLVTTDDPAHAADLADTLADGIRDGLYFERYHVEAIRAMPLMKKCGACAIDRPERGELSLFRVEKAVIVAAEDEEDAEEIAEEWFRDDDTADLRVVELNSSIALSEKEEVVAGENCGWTVKGFLSSPLTESEAARAYRKRVEISGQQRLPIGGAA